MLASGRRKAGESSSQNVVCNEMVSNTRKKPGKGAQLALPVLLKHDALLENYFGVANQKISALLRLGLKHRQETLYYLVGQTDAGKTHLASAAINYIEELGGTACYFALAELPKHDDACQEPGALFEGLDEYDLVVLDDIDRWLSSASRELALFNLFNQFKLSGRQLIVTARSVPTHLQLALEDLSSRLKSGLLLSLNTLIDDEKEAVLRAFAKQKGLLMEEGVSAFILKRGGRTMTELVSVMDILDHASLVEQRRLTVPFVKKILDW